MKTTCVLFALLQAADFATTATALRLGGEETNPLVRLFMVGDPMTGLVVAKVCALLIGAACVFGSKFRALRWANIVFVGIVIWNLTILARLI